MASRSDHRKAMRTCSHTGYCSPHCPTLKVSSPTDLHFLHPFQTVTSREPVAHKVKRFILSPPLRKNPQDDLDYMVAEHCSFAPQINVANIKCMPSTLFIIVSPLAHRDPVQHNPSSYMHSQLIELRLSNQYDLPQAFRLSYAFTPHPPNSCVSERSPKRHFHS